MSLTHLCPACEGETVYQVFSGGKEWFCPHCGCDGEYAEGEAPRRVASTARMAMASGLRILHLEDDAVDGELVAEVLRADGLSAEIKRVYTREAWVAALRQVPVTV